MTIRDADQALETAHPVYVALPKGVFLAACLLFVEGELTQATDGVERARRTAPPLIAK